jgi:hypothetical protein
MIRQLRKEDFDGLPHRMVRLLTSQDASQQIAQRIDVLLAILLSAQCTEGFDGQRIGVFCTDGREERFQLMQFVLKTFCEVAHDPSCCLAMDRSSIWDGFAWWGGERTGTGISV